jgi:hypothetical protein
MMASGILPYRRLRALMIQAHKQGNTRWSLPELQGAVKSDEFITSDVLPEEQWLCERIELERALYGPPSPDVPRLELRRTTTRQTLQGAFEVERYAVLFVQFLFVAEIALLFVSA